jgi:hypothetical protein
LVLQHQHSLQAFGGAVRDDEAVALGAEGPAALARLAERIGQVVAQLRLVEEVVGHVDALGELGHGGDAGGHGGLEAEGRVPELDAIGAVAGHAVGADPEVQVDLFAVALQALRVRPLLEPGRGHVEGLVDRRQALVVGVSLLALHQLRHAPVGDAVEPQGPEEVAPDADDGEEEHENGRDGPHGVGGRRGVAVLVESDLAVRLRVDLLADRGQQRVQGLGAAVGPQV